jgi:hypothetical protein
MNTTEIGFSTDDAINVCRAWLGECNEAGYESDMAGGWVEVFVDEYKRAMSMTDDQMTDWSDHDVLQYWHTILEEALRHIGNPYWGKPTSGELN